MSQMENGAGRVIGDLVKEKAWGMVDWFLFIAFNLYRPISQQLYYLLLP
jgi:hypothetical protein